MSTVTLTLPPAVAKYERAAFELATIIEAYSSQYSDHLSEGISRWSDGVFRIILDPNNEHLSERAIDRLVREKINEMQAMLTSSLHPEVKLKTAFLVDGQSVWDGQELLNHVSFCTEVSPHTGQRIQAIRHEFAQAMIDLLARFPLVQETSLTSVVRTSPVNQSLALTGPISHQEAMVHFSDLVKRAQKVKLKQSMEQTRWLLEDSRLIAEQTIATISARHAEDRLAYQADLTAHRQVVEERIAVIEESRNQEVGALIHQVTASLGELAVVKQELSEEQLAVSRLQQQVSQETLKRLELAAEVQRLRDQAGKRSCVIS